MVLLPPTSPLHGRLGARPVRRPIRPAARPRRLRRRGESRHRRDGGAGYPPRVPEPRRSGFARFRRGGLAARLPVHEHDGGKRTHGSLLRDPGAHSAARERVPRASRPGPGRTGRTGHRPRVAHQGQCRPGPRRGGCHFGAPGATRTIACCLVSPQRATRPRSRWCGGRDRVAVLRAERAGVRDSPQDEPRQSARRPTGGAPGAGQSDVGRLRRPPAEAAPRSEPAKGASPALGLGERLRPDVGRRALFVGQPRREARASHPRGSEFHGDPRPCPDVARHGGRSPRLLWMFSAAGVLPCTFRSLRAPW